MAKWPSMHARLKGMKPHLPPKKDDGRPTLGKEVDWEKNKTKKKSKKQYGMFRGGGEITHLFFFLLVLY